MAKTGLHRNGFLMGFGGMNATPGVGTRQFNTANIKVAFCLIPSATKTLSQIGVYLSAITGTLIAGDMKVQICADNGAFGPGSVLTTGTTVDAVPTGAGVVRFTGLSQVLIAGTIYWIVISNAAGSPSTNNFTMAQGTAGNAQALTGMDAPFFGTRKTSTDGGSTYPDIARATHNVLLEYSDSTQDGMLWTDYAAETSLHSVYEDRELGNVFTTPANARLRIAGVAMMTSRTGTPTGNFIYKIYEGDNLKATTIGLPATGILTGFSAFNRDNFAAPVTLEPATVYRVVMAETAQTDTLSNRFNAYPFTIPDDPIIHEQMPFQGTARKTYSTNGGGSFTDTDTQAIPMYLIGDDLQPFRVPQVNRSTVMPLSLTPIASVTYSLQAAGATRLGFDLGLIIGGSPVIDPEERIREYASLTEMVADGFDIASAEYVAASKYFAATGNPRRLLIGVQSSGETALQAVQAARDANGQWYGVYVPGANNDDHEDIAAYVETLTEPYSQYFLRSSDAGVLSGSPGNIFETLKNAQYSRTHGMYSESPHAVASVLGYVMANTTDFENSGYSLFTKSLPGVDVSSLTTQQVNNIEGNNGNVYISRGGLRPAYEKGTNFSGVFFDEIIYLDKLANEIQLSMAQLLYSVPKTPQTEEGVATVKSVISAACEKMKRIGFVAPGKWTGGQILGLHTGDFLPDGYLVLSELIIDQSAVDRAARLAPPIFAAIKLAGAIHSVVMQINVNR